MKKTAKYLVIGIVTFIILVGTLSIPKTVNSKEEMKSVKLGYPIAFIDQDFSRLDPPSFPLKQSFGSPWEDIWKVLPFQFILSFGIVFFILKYTFEGIERLVVHKPKK